MEEGRQYRMNPEVFRAASTGNSSFFERLADSNSSTFLQATIGKNTVLHVALQFKQIDAAKNIVNLSPRLVYETNSKSNTPLHVAASVGDSSMVKLVIDHAKTLDVEIGGQQQLLSMVNQDGDTALHVAVRYGNFEVVKELIEKDPAELAKQVNNAGESALFLAVDRQHYDMASHILYNAPDCSYAGRHGMNVMHALVINTSIYSNKGNSPFQSLRVTEKYEKTESRSRRVLITFVWVINMLFLIPLPKLLEDASEKQDKMQDVKRLLTFGTIPTGLVKEVTEKWPSTIEQHDGSGWTPLHIAAHMGNEEFVKLLLENGNSPAYVRVRNNEGLSALHIAAKEDYKGVIDILMEACPDIYELLDNKSRNVLHTAAESGSWAALNFFKNIPEFEGLVNEQDEEGNTPSNLAAINADTYMVQELGGSREIVSNATNKEGFTTMDNDLLTSKFRPPRAIISTLIPDRPAIQKILWEMGARLSLRGALLKMGIQNLDPRKKTKLAVDGKDNGDGKGGGNGKGNGNGKGRSKSDFLKQVREGNMLVATLIATVTFTAAFTVPGGFNQNGNVGEGLAVLSKITAFRVFLMANTLAFGLSTTSVFVHFLASTTSEEDAFHRQMERRTAFYTNWSIGAMLVAFIAGTYTVVPHSLGISVAVILSCCFLSSLFLPLLIKIKED